MEKLVNTPDGWSKFSGIKRKLVNKTILITTNKNRTLECSDNHPILTVEGFIHAQFLKIDDTLPTDDGFEVIIEIKIINEQKYVYDLLNVEKGHSYFTNGFISHNCVSFLGSSDNLISGAAMKNIKADALQYKPIRTNISYGYRIYEEPVRDKIYAMTCDVSRGKGLDYSTFHVIDITQIPYKQVATFRNNLITPTDFAAFIYNTAKAYNEAYTLIEINDIGGQVADILYFDYGYENLISTESAGTKGKRVSAGYGKNVDRGIRTTMTVKALGCSMLKLLIEQRKLIICDIETTNELSSFVKKGKSYEAEPGKHDDLVMALVLFAWLTTDTFFKNINDLDVMHTLRDLSDEQIFDELVPFGIISTYDMPQEEPRVEKIGNELWSVEDYGPDNMGSF